MKPDPCLIGLTGGLACGKSSVAAILREEGIPVRDADVIVHELYQDGHEGVRVVKELFGDDCLRDGIVDRKALAGRVMGDAESRKKLEERIHPLVRREISRWVRATDADILVVEAALLIESGGAGAYDLLLVVDCDPLEQERRARLRGMDGPQIEATIRAQVKRSTRLKTADVVIDNSGAQEYLLKKTHQAWEKIIGLCSAAVHRAPEEEEAL